ncbi:MAG: winged helix-turn-helix transcriptional regulator [Deltaproteobacteria bacterium]|nr:winged helix-turn-helix transcriptional regulator [Deltaproteobacteria bacterium]
MDALRRIVRSLRQSARAAEDRLGISAAQLFVLHEVGRGSKLSINELAERTLTDQSSVSVVVKRLAEKRLVERQPSAEDARRTEVMLTARGRALLRNAPEATQVELIAGLDRLAPADRASLARLLTELVAGLETASSAAPMFFEDGEAAVRTRPHAATPER